MCQVKNEKTFFDILKKQIIYVEKISNKEIYDGEFDIRLFKSKYSNLNSGVYTLFLHDVRLNPKEYKVKYKCLCGYINTIHLVKFIKKRTNKCPKCKESEEKSSKHSFMLKNKLYLPKVHKTTNIDEIIEESKEKFQLENKTFIDEYYTKNITIDEFNLIKDKIHSINGVNINDGEIKFEPFLMTNNQTKYSQYIIKDGNKILLSNVKFMCDNCGEIFNTSRRIKTKVNNVKIMCSKCTFCNKTFKLRSYITSFNDRITYQSNLELNFINICEKNNIRILDGGLIPYTFKDKTHKYRIDFFLPEYNIMVEIKDNHIWHKNQVKSGKWLAKESSAYDFCNKNDLTYKIIFNNQLEEFITSIKI